MPAPIYVVDAFAERPFEGNPAGVCLLDSEPASEWMQKVASEMKHSETAFVWPSEGNFGLRWFTPTVEVILCGHARQGATKRFRTSIERQYIHQSVIDAMLAKVIIRW